MGVSFRAQLLTWRQWNNKKIVRDLQIPHQELFVGEKLNQRIFDWITFKFRNEFRNELNKITVD